MNDQNNSTFDFVRDSECVKLVEDVWPFTMMCNLFNTYVCGFNNLPLKWEGLR